MRRQGEIATSFLCHFTKLKGDAAGALAVMAALQALCRSFGSPEVCCRCATSCGKHSDKALCNSQARYVAPDDIGYIYASLGERDHALDWLEKAVEEKESLIVWVYTRPEMDALRSDPRFVRLLRRMRLGA